MGNSCCASTTFRFKNFVVAAYPKDDDGEPNRDALGKLESYVLSNPERIPRVCRKISKLVAYDVAKGNVKRAGVGVQILRGLIRDANELEVFVPHVASICLLLLEKGVVEHRISAADLVTALCYRIQELHSSNMDQARRLVSDNKDRVAPFLKDMLVEGSGTNDIISLHCRFAALVALGNLANCIGPALSTLVTDLIPSVLTNLQHHLKETDMSLSSRVNQRRRQRASNVSAGHIDLADIRPLRSVVLPVEASEKDVAYYKGCVAAVAALAGACTQAALMPFLHTVAHFCSSYHGWSLPRFAPLVYRAIVVAIQRKPQVIGVNVCVHLCEVAEESVGTDRFPSVLRSLSAVLPHVPMTGGRPAAVIELIRSSLVSGAMFPASMITTSVREEDRASVAERNRGAIVELSKTLVHQIAAQANTPQLTRMARELCSLVGRVTLAPLLKLLFDVVLQFAPFVVEVQSDDDVALRHSNLIMATVAPFLSGSDRELRVSAMRIVTAMIAQDVPLASSLSSVASTSDAAAPPPLGSAADAGLSTVFNNTVEDVKDYICQWTFNADHTPQTVVEVANVMTSLLFRLRWDALTFVLPWVVAVQQRSSSAAPPPRPDPSKVGGDGSSPHVSSSGGDGHTSALQQAWLFAAVALLKAVGDHLNNPQLSQYARDVVARRLETQPSEIGMWFNSTLYNCASTNSGMTFVDGERDTYLAPIDAPPVTNLITIRTALVYLSQPPGDQKLMAAFQARDITEVERMVHQLALDIGRPQQRRSSSPATKVTLRMPTVASYSVLWKRDDSTTTPSSAAGPLSFGSLAGLPSPSGTAMVLQIRPLAMYLQETHGGDAANLLSTLSNTERASGEKFAEVARRSKSQSRSVEAIVSAHMNRFSKGLPSAALLPLPKTPHTATSLASRPATSLNSSFVLSSTTPFDPVSRNLVVNNSVVMPTAKARRLQRRDGAPSDAQASPFRLGTFDSRTPGYHRCDPVINYLEL